MHVGTFVFAQRYCVLSGATHDAWVGAQDLDKVDQDAEDLRLEECLEAVGLDYLLGRCTSDFLVDCTSLCRATMRVCVFPCTLHSVDTADLDVLGATLIAMLTVYFCGQPFVATQYGAHFC